MALSNKSSFLWTSAVILFVCLWSSCRANFITDFTRCGDTNTYCMGSSNGCIEDATCDLFLFVENRGPTHKPLFKFYNREQGHASDFAYNYLYFSRDRIPGYRHKDLPIYFGLPFVRVFSGDVYTQAASGVRIGPVSTIRLPDGKTLNYTKIETNAYNGGNNSDGNVYSLVQFEIPSGQWMNVSERGGPSAVIYEPTKDKVYVFMGRKRLLGDNGRYEPDYNSSALHVRSTTHARIGNNQEPNKAEVEIIPQFEEPPETTLPPTTTPPPETSSPPSVLPPDPSTGSSIDPSSDPSIDPSSDPSIDPSTSTVTNPDDGTSSTVTTTTVEDSSTESEIPTANGTMTEEPMSTVETTIAAQPPGGPGPVNPPKTQSKPPLPSPTPRPAKSDKQGNGLLIGLIVAVVVVALIIIALIAIVVTRNNKKKNKRSKSSDGDNHGPEKSVTKKQGTKKSEQKSNEVRSGIGSELNASPKSTLSV